MNKPLKKRRQSTIYRQSMALQEFSQKLLEKNDLLASEIQKIVRKLSVKQRMKKAIRHIYDAYYLRTIRNDIDLTNKKYLKFFWYLENNQFWIGFLFLLSIIYQIITFFELPFSDAEIEDDHNLLILEGIILTFLGIDSIITIILMVTKKENRFAFNPKRQFKLIVYYVCLIDFIIYNKDPNTMRFSRIFRTFIMPMYSKDLRRNLKGIMKASRDLFLLILLYLIIISIFSFVGINLIGRLENVDLRTQDYGDFFKFFSMLFMVATLDFYPDILIPPMLQGTYYSLFFIIYLLLFIFLFAPIPLAVVYEGFRRHRMEIAINDIIKQKSAMMASFISLDLTDQGYLTHAQFQEFVEQFYENSISKEDMTTLFSLIDQDFNDKVQFDEFYKFLHLIQDGSIFKLPERKPLECWESFRLYLNSRGLLKFVEGNVFSIGMLIITISNCVLIVTAFFIDDMKILDIFTLLDTVYLIFYGVECIVKIIALGIKPYFQEGWNIFDISLVILQIIFDYILFNIVSGNIVQSIKANRLLRLAKIQKVFRLFRAFRSIKIINFMLSGLEFLDIVRHLLYKIIICVPLIIRLMLPVQMIFFIYSCVGMYLFGKIQRNPENPYANSQCDSNLFEYQWGNCKYADFTSFSGSYLMMLQMFIAAEWNQVVFELTYDTDDMLSAMLFVGSFEFLSIFLLALIGGLVWEVFSVVSMQLRQAEEQIPQENEISQDQDIQAFSGTQIDSKYTPETAANQLRKKTLILNDDNPDVIKFQRKLRSDKKSKSLTKVYNPQRSISEHLIKDEKPDLAFSQPGSRNHLLPNYNSNRKPVGLYNTQFDNKIGTNIVEHYEQHFIDYQQWVIKQQGDGLDMNQVANDYMIHLRNEIKKDEIFQKKNVNISNHHLLIQSAVLRDASEVYIKQQEDRFFKMSFGKKFERIRELKFQNKFKVESKIIFSLMGILKFPKPNVKYYFQILYLIENYFTYQLLSDSSFFKMIHQINNKWYVIGIEDGQISFQKLDAGPWDYSEELFLQTNMRICQNLRSLYDTGNQECLQNVNKFSESVKLLAKHFDINLGSIDTNSSCLMYQIKNDKFIPSNIDTHSWKMKKSNVTIDDQSPNHNQIVFLESQNLINGQGFNKKDQSISLDEYKYVSKTIMFVLTQTQAKEKRIIYQNLIMLAQFLQDLVGVIHNYESNFFKQIDNLFELRNQQKVKSVPKL
ncbi:unnamed protein product [Paramecium primaurelia]|uniref:EF-hand domain-containing protein n=1 Tax=Paramecium primaurelia TaxID=5886 RepID=A0A8S1LU76_PARPR|nr:unnamed protein product [Paramecium primaurelia]